MRSPEQQLIQEIFAPLAEAADGAFGLTDDAALITPVAGTEQVITKDALVAGVHFFADDAPESVARKCLRVNLSDLAAKGARPRYYLLAIALPLDLERSWLERFAAGLAVDQRSYGCTLIGGDTVSTDGPLMVSITALGEVPEGGMITRAGAKPGDGVFVTGTIGDAAAGLGVRARSAFEGLPPGDLEFLRDRYHLPQPRVSATDMLQNFATASIDVSDGLLGDLQLLCLASGVGAEIDLASIPFSPAATTLIAAESISEEDLITGGDDYEILFTADARNADDTEAMSGAANCDVTRIGTVVDEARGVRCIGRDGKPLSIVRASYSHLGGRGSDG